RGAWAEYHLIQGHGEQARREVDAVFDRFDGQLPLDSLLPMVYALRVRAYLAVDDVDGARQSADLALGVRTGYPAIDDVRLPALRAWIAHLDGELHRAASGAEAALAAARELARGDVDAGVVYAWLT